MSKNRICLSCSGSMGDTFSTLCYKCNRGVCKECYDKINKQINEETLKNREQCVYCFSNFESQCSKCIQQINDKIEYQKNYGPDFLEYIYGEGIRDIGQVTTRLHFQTQWVPYGWHYCDCDQRCLCEKRAKETIKNQNHVIDLSLYEIGDPEGSGYAVTRCDQCILDPETGLLLVARNLIFLYNFLCSLCNT